MSGRDRQHGASLVEALVALVILVYAAVAALTLYDAAWSSYKGGENAVEQQQSVRIGFDELIADLQMTGFNHNSDGNDARPDEQIEAAFDTAIVIRADFDAQDTALAGTPEAALAGGAFDAVTTGNDEIVAFVLAKPDGSSSDTLTFHADVQDVPRDGAVESVSISDVALVHDDPPYTLYRITLNNDVGTWGSDDFFVRTPVAENVRSLSLRYFNKLNGQINGSFDLTTTTDDIGGSEAAASVGLRSTVYRVEIRLVGLTPDPDMNWRDPTDADPATQAHRKFELIGDVTPRNVGMTGVPDLPN